jgi:LPXTG-motif cell wall-anchored protein
MTRRRDFTFALVPVVVLLGVFGAAPANAAPSDGYASWTTSGSAGAWAGTLSLPAGFPATTLTSTSRTFGLSGGGSSWLPADTPAGELVGSSRDKPYLSINPAANSAGSVSTTTFTFASPTPVGVWGAAFGDIDAEVLGVSGTTAGGTAVAAADLGVAAFNYCLTTTTPNPCGGNPGLTPLPILTSGATSVTAADPLCPSVGANCNTAGASIWVEPAVALSSLSITSTYVSGIPAAQMWFASVARTVAGVITIGELPTVTVQLVEPDGDVIAAAPTAADGSFTLPPVIPAADYSLRVDPASLPAGFGAPDPVAVDVSAGDLTTVAAAVAPAPAVADPPAPLPAPAAIPAPELAATGADIAPIIIGAGVLLVLGVVALIVGKRRRSP